MGVKEAYLRLRTGVILETGWAFLHIHVDAGMLLGDIHHCSPSNHKLLRSEITVTDIGGSCKLDR